MIISNFGSQSKQTVYLKAGPSFGKMPALTHSRAIRYAF